MKLHFYSNEDLLYKGLPMGPMWELISKWREVAPEFGCEIITGPSNREEAIRDYRQRLTGKDHPIPDRGRTFFEVNDKLVYINDQDWTGIGADLYKVPGLIDLAIKFQYATDVDYGAYPFKVVPFTYFSRNDEEMLYRFRKVREEIVRKKSFRHSIVWGGSTWGIGATQRVCVAKSLEKHSKMAQSGRWNLEEYFQIVSESLAAASVRGTGEFCHRDVEFMCIGLPFFRKTYKNITRNPLIPDKHYYTIGGDEVGISQTIKHFLNHFEPNGKLREFSKEEWNQYLEIMDNGIKWFDENATIRSSFKLLLEILEEERITSPPEILQPRVIRKNKLFFHWPEDELPKYKNNSTLRHLIESWIGLSSDSSKIDISMGPSKRQIKLSKRYESPKHIHRSGEQKTVTLLEVNDKLVVIDTWDHAGIRPGILNIQDQIDLYIKCQFRPGLYNDLTFPISPFMYWTYPFTCEDMEHKILMERIKRIELMRSRRFRHSLVWLGVNRPRQPRKTVMKLLRARIPTRSFTGRSAGNIDLYFDRLVGATGCIGVRGLGDFCHRDIESMGVGTPIIRKMFKNRTFDPLIPNKHYFTIGGDEIGIEKTVEHFLDYFEPDGELRVFSETEWSQYEEISRNGIEWFDQNATAEGSLRLLLRILEKNSII